MKVHVCSGAMSERVSFAKPSLWAAVALSAMSWSAVTFGTTPAVAEGQADNPSQAIDPTWSVIVTAARPEALQDYAMGLGAALRVTVYRPSAGPGQRLTGKGHTLEGVASYYWQGQVTATGERFDPTALTAAHKTLPFGTRVRVTRVDTGSSVVVRINDRGPFTPGRVIDLSKRAAEEIGMTAKGLSKVTLEVLGK